MQSQTNRLILALTGTAIAATAANAQTLRVFYLEDWETVDLGNAVDERDPVDIDADGDTIIDFVVDQDGDGTPDVWTNRTGFTGLGWSVNTPANPALPNQLNLGVEEWREWALANSFWWAFGVDNQRRGEFATGFAAGSTIAIGDPDEWDDISAPFTDPVTGITTQRSPANLTRWNSTLISPEITLPATATEIAVDFSLSWRDEDIQDILVSAQFVDAAGMPVGAPAIVLSGDSDPAQPDFFDDQPNAQFAALATAAGADADVFPNGDTLPVPAGATAVQFSFFLGNAGNNWWFAIDNFALFAESTGGPIIAPGNFAIQSQALYETVTPAFSITRAIEADEYTVELSSTPDFAEVISTVNITADPAAFSLPFSFPLGSFNSGRFYVRASATNAIGTTDAINTASFLVVNNVIGDLDGDGDRDARDIADINQDGFADIFDLFDFLAALDEVNMGG